MREGKPDILWILCDQFRSDCLSILGHPTVETPNLDALAAEGTLFVNAYSPVPSCVPARACLFTGKNPEKTGFLGYQDGVNWEFDQMLPQVLRDNGYQTYCVGKTHFYPQKKHCGFEGLESYEAWQQLDPTYVNDYHEWLREQGGALEEELQHGLDDNSVTARASTLPEALHNNSWVVTRGLEFLRRRDRTRPYFLNLSFHRPHPPVDPPYFYWQEYMQKEMDAPWVGDWAAVHEKPVWQQQAWEGRLDEGRLKKFRMGYYAQIAHIDSQIGRLLRTLRSKKEMPDVIVFTSDHGEMLGDHHLFRKTYAYEGSAGVPCIIWQKDRTGRREETPVVLQDLYATTLELAGIPVPAGTDGISLCGLMERGERIRRAWIHGEHAACYSEAEAMQFLTDGKEKYIWFTGDGREQFFRLSEDPKECRDLAQDPAQADRIGVWRKRLIRLLWERGETTLTDGKRLIPGLLPAVRKGR